MKGNTKQLLQIGVAFLAVLIVVDFFLTDYPVLTWLALGITFLIFSIFILDVLLELTPKKEVRPTFIERRGEDALAQLEKLVRNALSEGNPESAAQLSERMQSIVLRATAYRFNVSDAELRDLAQHHPDLLEAQLNDPEIVSALTTAESVVESGDARRLNGLLTRVESWLP